MNELTLRIKRWFAGHITIPSELNETEVLQAVSVV